jgi:hypothetical protein
MVDDFALLGRYAEPIRRLPARELRVEDLAALRIEIEGKPATYYAPFDFINEQAKVVLVGITPGPKQLNPALQVARLGLQAGKRLEDVARSAKYAASFQGPMRAPLVNMLDELGLAECLEIETTAALFEEHRELLHTTSVVRYPTFANSVPYNGRNPAPLKSPLLRGYADGRLSDELERVSRALVISLGVPTQHVLTHLVNRGILSEQRCLLGMPHPGGAGIRWLRERFPQRQPGLRAQVHAWFKRDR